MRFHMGEHRWMYVYAISTPLYNRDGTLGACAASPESMQGLNGKLDSQAPGTGAWLKLTLNLGDAERYTHLRHQEQALDARR